MTKLTQKERRETRKAKTQTPTQTAKQTKDTDSVSDDDQSHDKMTAYMFKLFEIDCEMKQLYKEQFNIDPDTASGGSLFTEEEQIERYSQNIAFWQKLKAEYNDIDEMAQIRDPRIQYIIKQHDEIRMTAYIKFNRRPQVTEQIGKRVTEIMSSTIPKTVKEECCICLAPMFKYDQSPLECGHMFHKECLSGWAKKDNPTDSIYYVERIKKHIICFKEGENIFSCTCCRVEYTYDLRKGELKKVLATIHLKQGQGNLVHYIAHYRDTNAFVPKSQITNERKPNKEWATILNSLKQQWEKGHTDIYALMKLEPNPQCHRQFVLKTDDTSLPPMDYESGVAVGIHDGEPLVFRTIDIDELDEILDDC